MDGERIKRAKKLEDADTLFARLDALLLTKLALTPPSREDRKVFALQIDKLGRRIDAYSNQSRFRELFRHIRASSFEVATLSELASRIFSGTTPLAKSDAYVPPPGGVRFIRSGEITADGEVTATSEVHVAEEIHEGPLKRSQLEKGDLLVAIVGATIGKVGVFNRSEPANINQAIAAVRLNSEKVTPEFVCLYLRSSIGQALLDFFKRPVARANINLEEVGEIPVIIPAKEVQDEIIAESHRLREAARGLRSEAETGWQAAKRWFEDQLLNPNKA
jgi:type I restriction enzyme S subunit